MSEGNQQRLLARHRAVMPSWLALYYEEPIELVRGEGRYVWDGDGTRYLDMFGGILTTMSGYGVPEIVDAIREQAAKMLHSSTLYLIEPAVRLAEQIATLAPCGDDAKVFFTSSGTEANEAALLIATTHSSSNQVLALRNSYHGRSFGAMALTGNRAWSASSLSPISVGWVHGPDRRRSPWPHATDSEYIAACVADLRSVLETATSGDVSCMIVEPIQGVGGFATPPDGLYRAFKEVLDEYGILLIADEVQTGWGRTGEHFWGIEAHDVQPDLMTFAKGVGNGLALGGVVAREQLMDCVGPNSISTFGGSPLACAGALANLEHVLGNDLPGNALARGNYMLAQLRKLANESELIADVRGKGLMIGVELVDPVTGVESAAAAAQVLEECKARGVLIGKGGLKGNCLRIAPALSITAEEADEGFEALAAAIDAVERALSGATSKVAEGAHA